MNKIRKAYNKRFVNNIFYTGDVYMGITNLLVNFTSIHISIFNLGIIKLTLSLPEKQSRLQGDTSGISNNEFLKYLLIFMY